MTHRSALLGATFLAAGVAVSAGAFAQPVDGLYVGGGLGFTYTEDLKVKNITVPTGSPPIEAGKLHSDGGFVGLASIGYGLGNGLRIELEGNYRDEHTTLKKNADYYGGGNVQQYGPMVNVLYDVYGLSVPVVPYVGVGGGYIFRNLQSGHANSVVAPSTSVSVDNSAEGAPAFQVIAGAAYPISAVPGLALTAEYRFLGLVESDKWDGTATNNVTHVSAGTTFKVGDAWNHSVLVGMRYAFNAAPPPPPPAPAPVAAPAPAPARTYLVFFDWDKADLTDRAHQVIAEAAQASTRVQVTRIEVNGYADRTGTAAYNLALSRRRADNVAAELVKDGVPQAAIAIQAFGDTHLLVPTAPGVREPQNRRVEIILK